MELAHEARSVPGLTSQLDFSILSAQSASSADDSLIDQPPVRRPGQLLLLALPLGPGRLVLERFEVAQLPLEFVVALEAILGERAVADGRQHGAAGLGGVGAVAEPATWGDRVDLGIHVAQGLAAAPELQLAHPRRVERQTSTGPPDQLAMGRRTPPLAVVADGLDALEVAAQKGVDEGRLAQARRAEQRNRTASREEGFKAREA